MSRTHNPRQGLMPLTRYAHSPTSRLAAVEFHFWGYDRPDNINTTQSLASHQEYIIQQCYWTDIPISPVFTGSVIPSNDYSPITNRPPVSNQFLADAIRIRAGISLGTFCNRMVKELPCVSLCSCWPPPYSSGRELDHFLTITTNQGGEGCCRCIQGGEGMASHRGC